MAIDTKICGINSAPALEAAVKGGARFVGFVFYARSPRALDAEAAAALAGRVPRGISRVGLIVDKSNESVDAILRQVPLDMLQLHGQETPARVGEIRRRFGKPVMKAIKVATAADVESCRGVRRHRRLAAVRRQGAAADGQRPARRQCRQLRLDACSPTGAGTGPGCCPAGSMPRILAEAVRVTGAARWSMCHQVSRTGRASELQAKIAAFLTLARSLSPGA